MALRFHLDENVHTARAAALRRRGIDVSLPADDGLIGASDEQHLAFSRENGRVVITHDSDFLRLHAEGLEHAGIAFCHVRQYSLRQLIRVVSRMTVTLNAESMVNRIEYL